MKIFYISEFEQEALYGLRYGAYCLYQFLRSRMDFVSGEVGRKPMLSRFTLREAMFIEPKRGRAKADSGTPSEQAVRGFEEELKEAGLLEYRSIPSQKQLIFFLPLAVKAKNLPREVQQVSGELQQVSPQHGQTQAAQGFAGNQQQKVQQSQSGELQHTSGLIDKGLIDTPLNPSVAESVGLPPSVRENGHDSDFEEKDPALEASAISEKVLQIAKLAQHYGHTGIHCIALKASNAADAVQQPLADWEAAFESVKRSKPDQCLPLSYMLPKLADLRAKSLSSAKSESAGGAKAPWQRGRKAKPKGFDAINYHYGVNADGSF
jgi:hypothetical protein